MVLVRHRCPPHDHYSHHDFLVEMIATSWFAKIFSSLIYSDDSSASFTACAAAFATDWPQFLGPTRNGVYPGNDLGDSWPAQGPPVVWQKSVGQGFSGPVV